MPLPYLDATAGYSDPASTNLKYLQRYVDEDGVVRARWAAPDSEHEYYSCDGWRVPELLILPQTSEDLNRLTWPQIAEISKKAAEDPEPYLYMTDADHKLEKDVDLSAIGCSSTVKARIVGVGQDVDENDNAVGLTLMLCDGLVPVNLPYNAAGSNYNKNPIKTNHLPKIEEALPADLRALIKPMKKNFVMGGLWDSFEQHGISHTNDRLTLLAIGEVMTKAFEERIAGSRNIVVWKAEGAKYQWFDSHDTDEDRIIYQADGSASSWHLRSLYSNGRGYTRVSETGRILDSAGSENPYLPCALFTI